MDHPRGRPTDGELELDDGVESLAYWRARRERLPWYRRADRREAEEMAAAWEGRVARAAASSSGAPLRSRAGAAALVARSSAGRWTGRLARRAKLTLLGFAAVGGAAFALVDALL